MDLFGDNSDSEIEPLGLDLLPPAEKLQACITTTTFDGLLDEPLQLHEDLAKGCGGQIWPAGELLGKYLLRRYKGTDGLRGKRIVELGAGGGLVGLAVASACDLEGSEFFITDMDAMMDILEDNIKLNGFEDRVKMELLDWTDPLPPVIAEKPIDYVIAADCVYYEPAFPLLEKTLVDLVSDNTVVFFCFKKRRRADLTFMKAIKKRLNVVEMKDHPEYSKHDTDRASYSRESLFLYIMTKKTA